MAGSRRHILCETLFYVSINLWTFYNVREGSVGIDDKYKKNAYLGTPDIVKGWETSLQNSIFMTIYGTNSTHETLLPSIMNRWQLSQKNCINYCDEKV